MQFTDDSAAIVAERFRMLAEPMRLRLLNALRGGEQTVGNLVEAVSASQANVSKHLQLLYRAGFLDRRKDGTACYYWISDPSVFALCDMMCGGVRDELDRKRRLLRQRA